MSRTEAKLDSKKVEKICKRLSQSSNIVEIAKEFKVLYGDVYRIYNRVSYKEISQKYDFKKIEKKKLERAKNPISITSLNKDIINYICDLKDSGYPTSEIAKHIGLDKEKLRRILSADTVSQEFNEIVLSRGIYTKKKGDIRSSQMDIIKISRMFKRGKTIREIATHLNCPYIRIWSIQNGKTNLSTTSRMKDISWMTDTGREAVKRYLKRI